MITDIHTHVFHPRVAEKAVARLAGLGFSPVGPGTVDDLLARAARAGIERVVCHTAALNGSQVRPANNFALSLARRVRHPGEPVLVPFGGVHPDCPFWPEELDRLEAAGIKGLKFHPNFQNLGFDDARMFPIMEAIGSRFVLMCHVGCEKPLETNPASPYKLAKLLGSFPRARVIAAHLGGYADGAAALDALAGKDVWLDTSNTAGMRREEIAAIVRRHPRDRLLFGTDYPLFDPAAEMAAQPERLGFSAAEMDAITRNASALLDV